MKKLYQDFNFTAPTIALIESANEIIEEYIQAGFVLTLRQLYYQFVARGLLENSQRNYKRLGSVINNGRLAGWIDWDAIEDRTRRLNTVTHWESPQQIIRSAAKGYRRDLWAGQKYRVEVWIEKEALAGVVEQPCEDLDVPFFSCRGYVSQSEQRKAGERVRRRIAGGQQTIILHLGDHDPSGIDMTRDNRDRIRLFSGSPAGWVKRIALNMDQIEEIKPVPNPAKLSDSRAHDYVKKFGRNSWELDALDPRYIDQLIRGHVHKYIDQGQWHESITRQESDRDRLVKIIDQV